MTQNRFTLSQEFLLEFIGLILQKCKHCPHWQSGASSSAAPAVPSQLPDLFRPIFCLWVHRSKFLKFYHQRDSSRLGIKITSIQVAFNWCFPTKNFPYVSEGSNPIWYQRYHHCYSTPSTTLRQLPEWSPHILPLPLLFTCIHSYRKKRFWKIPGKIVRVFWLF